MEKFRRSPGPRVKRRCQPARFVEESAEIDRLVLLLARLSGSSSAAANGAAERSRAEDGGAGFATGVAADSDRAGGSPGAPCSAASRFDPRPRQMASGRQALQRL